MYSVVTIWHWGNPGSSYEMCNYNVKMTTDSLEQAISEATYYRNLYDRDPETHCLEVLIRINKGT